MNILKDIEKDREYLVQLATKSENRENVFALDDMLGKLDVMHDLVDAWIDEKLSDLRLLTDKRIELELAQCEHMLANPQPRDGYVKYWIRKRKNLLLLQKLVRAWDGDTIADVSFAVSIQE